MCGIAGFYNIKNDREAGQAVALGQAMAASLSHRGPDAQDVWKCPNHGLVLAHRRLAIIDLTDDGQQPMTSPSERYIVTYNGEIYNYLSLKTELEALGQVFKTRTDTEVMLAAFDHWGIHQTLQKLNGMFAIALYDKKEHVLHFIRDRFGKKPLYVGWAGDDLVFGSELKSLRVHNDFKKEINRDVLTQYMQYGYVHAPFSIYQNVWQLLPAARMSLDLSALKRQENLAEYMQTYWSLKSVTDNGKANLIRSGEAEIINEFEALLEQAVSERMVSDVPLGAFLSGGIDSSAVVALMQKQSSAPVKTFSIGFDAVGYNEAEHAKEIANYLQTDHHEFYITPKDAMDVIPKLPDIYDEPFADASQIPTYLISKLAREQVTVAMTGDGGDEILGGYDRHVKVAALWQKFSILPAPIRKITAKALSSMPDIMLQALKPSDPLFAAKAKRAFGLMGLKNSQEIYEALLRACPDDGVVIGGNAPTPPLQNKEFWPFKPLTFSEEMIYGDMLSYRVNDIMVKSDRASMAASLEARAPLMDYKLAEYCWRLPHDMKVRGGAGKWLLRQVLKRHIPEKLYQRPKMGFSVPIHDWLRGALRPWADDLLSVNKLRAQGYLEADKIAIRWQEFLKSDNPNTPKDLWAILMFQAWLQNEK